MKKVKINKKVLLKIITIFLTESITFTLCGCQSISDEKKLEKHKYGLCLDTSNMGEYFVTQDEQQILRIINNSSKSVYCDKKYPNENINDLYKYMNEELLLAAEDYQEIDYINLEKYINGENTYYLLPQTTNGADDKIIDNEKWYVTKGNYSGKADLGYVEIMLVNGKIDRICRRVIEDSNKKSNDVLIDIISGRKIYPNTKAVSEFVIDNMTYENSEIQFIPFTDLFTKGVKEAYSTNEIVEIYYQIVGKTKEEAQCIVSNTYNNKSLVKTTN